MKKTLIFVFILGFTSGFTSVSFAKLAPVDPVDAPSATVPTAPVEDISTDDMPDTEVSGAGVPGEQQQGNQFGSCQEAKVNIQMKCSLNPSYVAAQNKQGLFGFLGQGNKRTGAAQQSEDTADTAKVGLASMGAIRKECTEAATDCLNICKKEFDQVQRENSSYTEPTKTQHYTQRVVPKHSEVTSTSKICQQEQTTVAASTGAAMSEMGGILEKALAALAALKGSGGSEGVSPFEASATETSDICATAGDNAQYMPSCNGNGDPLGTRGGNLVTTGVGGLTAGSGAGDLMTASQGEPGGESNPSSDNSSGFGGFGSAGAGFGSGGGLGSSGSGDGADGSASAIDSDIHKGFIGASGVSGSSGGFSGGGGSTPKLSPFAGGGAANIQSAALNRQLNTLKNKHTSKRSPASAGGANGRFDDNWSVVSRAYKKNSKTMFHGEK